MYLKMMPFNSPVKHDYKYEDLSEKTHEKFLSLCRRGKVGRRQTIGYEKKYFKEIPALMADIM